MRGSDVRNVNLFAYVDLETHGLADHPPRVIRRITEEVLADMSTKFVACHAKIS